MSVARESVILLYSDGVAQVEIARRAGVSRQRIHQIVKSFSHEYLRRRFAELQRTSSATLARNRRARESAEATRRRSAWLREVRTAYVRAHPRAGPKPEIRGDSLPEGMLRPDGACPPAKRQPFLRIVV